MPRYTLRLMATYRIPSMLDVEADSDEAAIEMAKTANLAAFTMDTSYAARDSEVEGDEIVFIDTIEDDASITLEDMEIDRRAEGEPFSWEAVALVKQIARLQTEEELAASGCESQGDDAIESMNSLIHKARRLCKHAERQNDKPER